MTHIAFLGAGKMGSGMISCLLKAGVDVTAYNRTSEKLNRLVARGVRLAQSPAEAVRSAELVFSMVTDDKASEEIWFGRHGALHGPMMKDAVLVECSTLSYQWITRFHEKAAQHGFASADCPVAGRPSAAAEGALRIFAGGAPEVIARISPLLSAFGKSVMHLGPAGTGTAFKLIYNMLSAIQLASLAEAMSACDALGIDLMLAANEFASGNIGSVNIKYHGELMASGKRIDPPPFTGNARLKDTDYAIQLLETLGSEGLTARSTAKLYRSMVGKGLGSCSDTDLFNSLTIASPGIIDSPNHAT